MTAPSPSRAVWRKSKRSDGSNACVEAVCVAGMITLRDSKNPCGTRLTFSPDQWNVFLNQVKDGSHNL